MSRRVASPLFIGRADQLAALQSAFDRSIAGNPVVVLVGGEAGVGKSRLVQEFVSIVTRGQASVLSGGCIEVSEGRLPFAPVVEALRGFIGGAGSEATAAASPLAAGEIDRLLGPARSEFARLLPELGDAPAPALATSSSLDSAQTRFFELFLGFLHRLADRGPTVLVIEDLHWSDDSTRDLLRFLIRNLRRPGVMMLATYRTDEIHRRHPLRPFLASIERADGVEHIELERFSLGEVYEQLRSILDQHPDPELVREAFELSEGIPFYVEELIASGYGSVTRRLPASLRDAILVRVEGLTPESQEMLSVAATAGRRVDHPLLQTISSLDEARLNQAVRESVEHHLLVPDDTEHSYAFRHALLREAIYTDLLPGQRTALHSTFADVLQRHPELGSGDASAAAELAYHLHEAKRLDLALPASIEAGRAAEQVFAFSEALQHYERALALWDQVAEPESRSGTSRIGLIRRAAETAYLSRRGPRAIAYVKRALELIDPAEDPVTAGLLHERLGRYLWVEGDGTRAAAAYREAVRLVPVDPPTAERARVLSAQGQMLMLMSHISESRECCEEAVRIATQVGARAVLGHALNTLGVDLAQQGMFDAGVAHLRRARDIAFEINDADDIGRTYPNLATIFASAGRYDEALAEWDEGTRVMEPLGGGAGYVPFFRADSAELLYTIGRWDEAEQRLDETGDQSDMQRAMRLMTRSQLAAGRGRLDDARADIEEAARHSRLIVDPQFIGPFLRAKATLALWAGKPDEARDAVEGGLRALGDIEEYADLLWLCFLGIRAEADLASAGRADLELALAKLELVRRLAKTGSAQGVGAAAAAASAEAEYLRLTSDSDPAAWRRAAELWLDIEHPFVAAYCLYREAESHVLRAESDAAVQPLSRAHQIAIELRAALLLRDIESLARRARLSLDGMKVAQDGSPLLTARELEVLRLIAQGKTNSEIGRLLFISTKTASVHVSHILAKLGVSSRVQAAGLARDYGLLETR